MTTLSEDYQYYVEKANPVSFPVARPNWENIAEKYSIPVESAKFLSCYGSFYVYGRRLLFGEPQNLSGVLPLVFQGDRDFIHSDTVVIAYSAFGKLLCWNRKLDSIEIDLLHSTIACRELVRPSKPTRNRDISFDGMITVFDPDVLDVEDENGDLLFAKAQKKLGPLNYGECYGFRLAPPLGGRRTLDKLERVSAPEHFSFLAQLQPFTLIDYGTTQDFGLRVIRQIG